MGCSRPRSRRDPHPSVQKAAFIFLALNLNRHLQVIEFPGGDSTYARVYSGPGPYGSGDALVPVTLSFADVNGDNRPDMLVQFGDSRIVFMNDGSTFRPLRSDERPLVERYLQQHSVSPGGVMGRAIHYTSRPDFFTVSWQAEWTASHYC